MNPQPPANLKVILIEDDQLLRRLLIERADTPDSGIVILDTAEGGEAGLELIYTRDADLALIDISLPGMTGLEVLRRAAAARTETKLVMLTSSIDPRNITAAMSLGADGYIDKSDPKEMFEIIRRVGAGERLISARARTALFAGADPGKPIRVPGPDQLELLRLLAGGRKLREAARALVASEARCREMLAGAEDSLGTDGITQTVATAVSLGLVSAED